VGDAVDKKDSRWELVHKAYSLCSAVLPFKNEEKIFMCGRFIQTAVKTRAKFDFRVKKWYYLEKFPKGESN
jgi:hypothetical protein